MLVFGGHNGTDTERNRRTGAGLVVIYGNEEAIS